MLLARSWQARLLLLTVVHPGQFFGDQRLSARDRRDRAEARLRADVDARDVSVTVRVEEGPASESILRVAEAEACDVIVTGVGGEHTLGRWSFGSTLDVLIRRATPPVLVVRRRASRDYRRIVVPSDFSGESRRALRETLSLFPDQEVSLFHAYATPNVETEGLNLATVQAQAWSAAESEGGAFLHDCELSTEHRRRVGLVVAHGPPGLALNDYVEHRGIDLIALATRARSPLVDALIGGVAKHILDEATVDVLVLRQ